MKYQLIEKSHFNSYVVNASPAAQLINQTYL